MRIALSIFFLALALLCDAQAEKASVFRVAKGAKIDLGITADTLVQFQKYSFGIYGLISANEISKVEFPGGEVNFNDSFITVQPQKAVKLTSLHVYTHRSAEVYRKQFAVVPAAMPPNVAFGRGLQIRKMLNDIRWSTNFPNSKSDTIDKSVLEKQVRDRLTSLTPAFPVGYNSGRTIVFTATLTIKNKGSSQAFVLDLLQLNDSLIQKLKNSQSGDLISIHEVRFQCNGPKPDVTVLGPYKFLVK
jgi:hypothetical protein